jgi:hypothetical protein
VDEHFAAEGWELFDEVWMHAHLNRMAANLLRNQVSAVFAKLFLKDIGQMPTSVASRK